MTTERRALQRGQEAEIAITYVSAQVFRVRPGLMSEKLQTTGTPRGFWMLAMPPGGTAGSRLQMHAMLQTLLDLTSQGQGPKGLLGSGTKPKEL